MKEPDITFWKSLKWPGLTPSAVMIRELAAQIPVRLAALSYKSSRHFLWVVFIGGTGTGKSTLFNALIGKPLSETGVERPKTSGPLVYAHKDTPEKVMRTLMDALKKVSEDPALRSAIEKLGDEPRFGGPEFVKQGIKRAQEAGVPLLKDLGIYVGR